MNELLRRDAGKEFFVEIIMKEEINPMKITYFFFKLKRIHRFLLNLGPQYP